MRALLMTGILVILLIVAAAFGGLAGALGDANLHDASMTSRDHGEDGAEVHGNIAIALEEFAAIYQPLLASVRNL